MNLLARFFAWFLIVLGFPGFPFALLLAQVKQMGDGTGNESSALAFHSWCLLFGTCIWGAAIWGAVWFWNHATITFT